MAMELDGLQLLNRSLVRYPKICFNWLAQGLHHVYIVNHKMIGHPSPPGMQECNDVIIQESSITFAIWYLPLDKCLIIT